MELLGSRVNTTASGIGFVVVVLFVTSFWVFIPDADDHFDSFSIPTATVIDGPFDIYVVESAILDARQSVTLSSELPSNKAKVLSLAAEGDLIQKGEVVAKFDPTPFEEEIHKIESNLREEQAKLVQEQAELSLQLGGNKDRKEQLEYQLAMAELKLSTLQQGGVPIRLARAEKELSKAINEYEKAREFSVAQQELFDAGFVNANSVREAKNKEKEKLAEKKIRQRDADTLNNITIPAELKRAGLDIDNRNRELQGFENSRLQKIVQRDAALLRIRNKIANLELALENTKQQLKKCTITAPVSGIVLYKEISLQNEKRKAQVGDSLWSRHSFAVIPDMSSMVAYVNIRESEVGKITEGQTVSVRPEAYPNLTLTGSVEAVGALAANDEVQRDTNFFKVRIALTDIDDRLRPGMTAKASILAKHYQNAVRIPVEAVFYDNQQAVSFLWNDGNPLRNNVKLGESDGNHIVILDGLSPGEEVMLTYPESFESASSLTSS